MNIKKNKNQLIISIIVGVAIAVVSYQVMGKLKIENENLKKLTQTSEVAPPKKIVYVVAKADIKKGTKVEASNLTTKQFPIEIEGALEDSSKIAGLVAAQDIKADSPIVEDYFKVSDMDTISVEPRKGYRAVGVFMASEQFPTFAKIGDYVDIYSVKNLMQAQNVKILNIEKIGTGTHKSIMLEIKDKDVPAFITAANEDKVIFVQRNRHENPTYSFSIASYTLNSQGLPQPPELVEISDISAENEIPVPSYKSKATSSKKTKQKVAKQEDEIPVVQAQTKNVDEIEFISGDKKMIIGAPKQW